MSLRTSIASRRAGLFPVLLLAASLATLAGCGGAGPYGHAPTYVPLGDEEKAMRDTREYDPVMAGRNPEAWRKGQVTLFGVVTARAAGPGGSADVTLDLRRLDTRNLCEDMHDDDSCRVTVSDRDFGVVHALVTLRGPDDAGEHSVGAGSLLRVVGRLREGADAKDGAPVIQASYYRHWPRFFFVTRGAARSMRQ